MIKIIVLISSISLFACYSKEPIKVAPVFFQRDQEMLMREHISVMTMEGAKSIINVNDRTIVVAIATWCPYAKIFVKTINDKRVAPSFDGYTWVFVVVENEWPYIRKQIVEHDGTDELNGLSVNEVLTIIEAKAKKGPLVDPSILDLLPGKWFTLPNDSVVKIKSFPSLYSRESGEFDSHPIKMVAAICPAAIEVHESYVAQLQEE